MLLCIGLYSCSENKKKIKIKARVFSSRFTKNILPRNLAYEFFYFAHWAKCFNFTDKCYYFMLFEIRNKSRVLLGDIFKINQSGRFKNLALKFRVKFKTKNRPGLAFICRDQVVQANSFELKSRFLISKLGQSYSPVYMEHLGLNNSKILSYNNTDRNF